MLKVGLTGGIGSGKSYVAKIFEDKYGIPVYSSDNRAKYLMVNSDLKNKVIENFGEDSYINGEINKAKFNKLLFEDKDALSLMNSIVKPFMTKDFEIFCEDLESPYVIKESAILFESGDNNSIDRAICVIADMDVRLSRVMLRDKMTEELFNNKVANQSSDEDKIEKSDFIIYNNDDSDLLGQIEAIHNSLITPYCHICYSTDIEPEFVCDICGQFYCEDCSYTYTLHYQFQGSRCCSCSDQNRRKPLNKRDSKINFLLK